MPGDVLPIGWEERAHRRMLYIQLEMCWAQGSVTDWSQQSRRGTLELEGSVPNEFLTLDQNILEHNLQENDVERVYVQGLLA